MKSNSNIALSCLAVLAIAVSSAFAGGESNSINAKMYAVSEVVLAEHPNIEQGVSPSSIRFAAGRPYRELTNDLWVYTQFQPNSEMARADGCDLLLIAFENRRVSEIYLMNDEAKSIIRDRIKQGDKSHDVLLAAVSPQKSIEVASNE